MLRERCPLATRRDILKLSFACLGVPAKADDIASVRSRLPAGAPPGVASIIANTLGKDPRSLNTDWFGATLMQGLLEWRGRGFPEVRAFAQNWLAFHRQTTTVSRCECPASRVVTAAGIPITTYAGHYAVALPCYEMCIQFGDHSARSVCLAVADIILHQAARNRLGMAAHDDGAEFAIPDTAYFVVTPLLMAADLARGDSAAVFREQALFQLEQYTRTFLDARLGLAKTALLRAGLGTTYWTRATRWLMWAINSALRYLPPRDPQAPAIQADLLRLAEGVARVQDHSGGLHVWLDDPSSPLETTGAAMCGMAIHEAVRKTWLLETFAPVAVRAWAFVKHNITDDGRIRNAYTGWAIPAEKHELRMDDRDMGWIPGTVLRAANEFTRTGAA